MRKIYFVALREYLAAVKTKAFIISLILMPLMMGGALFAQRQLQKSVDESTYKVAVIDHTPGGTLAKAIADAAEKRDRVDRIDPETGQPIGPSFKIEIVPPAPLDDPAAVDRQRLALSDRTRNKDLLAFIEIGEDVLDPNLNAFLPLARKATTQMSADASPAQMQGNLFAMLNELPDNAVIRYSTSQPTLMAFRNWLTQAIAQPIFVRRAMRLGWDVTQIPNAVNAILPTPIVDRGMAERTSAGTIDYESNQANVLTNMLVPGTLVALMLIAVLVGASPLSTNIIEEKQLRIAEVLLGGLHPFELMFGKLLGGAATSLTLAAIYFAGIFAAAYQFGFLQYVRPETIAWFILFTLIGVLMYGSLFVAAGAAVTNLKEAQTTLSPVMILIAAPFFVFSTILQYPNGVLARTASFFPLTAPTTAVLRAAIPRGAARWELALSAGISIVGMLVTIWIAGRVFRAGMLLTSKPASLKEAIGWIVRG